MNSIIESVASSMDCDNLELVEYRPYILQDFKEIGACPGVILDLVKRNTHNYPALKILDLGCGKGSVSIELARGLNCFCHVIDAVEGFIKEAIIFASEKGVSEQCFFETADIRERTKDLKDYNVILLASTGPLFGDYESTLKGVSPCLAIDGIVIMDDWYKIKNDNFTHVRLFEKQEILRQAEAAGMLLSDEHIHEKSTELGNSYSEEYENLKKRCQELAQIHPQKAEMFNSYVNKQKEEYQILKNNVICSALVFINK